MARGTPRFRSDGSFSGFISATVDITEIKETSQRKNDFIGMVSQELKTPLTSSIGYVQIALKRAQAIGDTVAVNMMQRTERQLN